MGSRKNSTSRSGEDGLYRRLEGGIDRHDTAVRLHDEQVLCKAPLLQFVVKYLEVAAGSGLNIGIDHGRAGALELAEEGQNLGCGDNMQIGPVLFQQGFGTQFVGGVDI